MTEGLAAAHAMGLIHRDIKPANVLIDEAEDCAKITDFGLALAIDKTQNAEIAGTPNYLAPEQAAGTTVDQRADLFGLGSTFYHMATGKIPFNGANISETLRSVSKDRPQPICEIAPQTPKWLCDIISILLNKNRSDRFQSRLAILPPFSLNANAYGMRVIC